MVGLALNLPLVLVLVFSQSVQREALTLNLIIIIGVASPILHSLTRFSSSSSWDEAPDRSICVTEAAFASSFKLAVPAVMLSLLVKTLVSLFAATRKRSDPSSTFAFKAPLVALPYLFLLPSLTASLVVGRRDAYAALEVSALGCAISDQRLSLALASLSVALLSVGFLVLPVLGILLFQRYVYARRLPPSAQATLAKYSVGRWLCVRSALATLSFAAFFV
jgi:flagellar biosynthesis protein FliQ